MLSTAPAKWQGPAIPAVAATPKEQNQGKGCAGFLWHLPPLEAGAAAESQPMEQEGGSDKTLDLDG